MSGRTGGCTSGHALSASIPVMRIELPVPAISCAHGSLGRCTVLRLARGAPAAAAGYPEKACRASLSLRACSMEACGSMAFTSSLYVGLEDTVNKREEIG